MVDKALLDRIAELERRLKRLETRPTMLDATEESNKYFAKMQTEKALSQGNYK